MLNKKKLNPLIMFSMYLCIFVVSFMIAKKNTNLLFVNLSMNKCLQFNFLNSVLSFFSFKINKNNIIKKMKIPISYSNYSERLILKLNQKHLKIVLIL